MRRRAFSDPGGEVVNAPVGSELWAKRWRLEFQGVVEDLPRAPERAERFIVQGHEHRVWTLLNREDGSSFASFEEFCEAPKPWGLGTPHATITAYLEALHGRRALQLVTVAPAKSPPGVAAHKGTERPLPNRKDKALRAILRAPEAARELYKAGLLGQKEAAKLGQKNPTPEDAKRAHEVAYALETQAKALGKPKGETERVATQRALNRRARQLIGDDTDDRVAKLLRTIARLPEADRCRLLDALAEHYGKPAAEEE